MMKRLPSKPELDPDDKVTGARCEESVGELPCVRRRGHKPVLFKSDLREFRGTLINHTGRAGDHWYAW